MSRPVRVFYSVISQRFYASRTYKEVAPGIVEITGDKFDVSNDIAELVIRHGITFAQKSDELSDEEVDEIDNAIMDGPR